MDQQWVGQVPDLPATHAGDAGLLDWTRLFTVVLLGTFTWNGRAFSAATDTHGIPAIKNLAFGV
jgi:hypothetical protein